MAILWRCSRACGRFRAVMKSHQHSISRSGPKCRHVSCDPRVRLKTAYGRLGRRVTRPLGTAEGPRHAEATMQLQGDVPRMPSRPSRSPTVSRELLRKRRSATKRQDGRGPPNPATMGKRHSTGRRPRHHRPTFLPALPRLSSTLRQPSSNSTAGRKCPRCAPTVLPGSHLALAPERSPGHSPGRPSHAGSNSGPPPKTTGAGHRFGLPEEADFPCIPPCRVSSSRNRRPRPLHGDAPEGRRIQGDPEAIRRKFRTRLDGPSGSTGFTSRCRNP
jgi:hypothetical protein